MKVKPKVSKVASKRNLYKRREIEAVSPHIAPAAIERAGKKADSIVEVISSERVPIEKLAWNHEKLDERVNEIYRNSAQVAPVEISPMPPALGPIPDPNDRPRTVTLNIPESLHDHLASIAANRRLPLEEIINRILFFARNLAFESRPLIFTDSERQQLEKILNANFFTPESVIQKAERMLALTVEGTVIYMSEPQLQKLAWNHESEWKDKEERKKLLAAFTQDSINKALGIY